ncbi:MAG TPA: zf-HC2 domain-containing protein [Pyrinomonadaceae bacterium]
MNCERCQELIGDLLEGTLSGADESTLKTHLDECLDCESVRQDFGAILSYCQTHRGEYDSPPNPTALWLRIRNTIESGTLQTTPVVAPVTAARKPFFGGLLGRSWELSLPQLAAFAAALVLFVSIATVVGVRRMEPASAEEPRTVASEASVNDRIWQRQQVINYWNQRVELNKARWSADMRATFERNLSVIDEALGQSLNELKRNPHDEFSEQMLNEALNDKLALLKEFSDL